jgi:hypothetical protein
MMLNFSPRFTQAQLATNLNLALLADKQDKLSARVEIDGRQLKAIVEKEQEFERRFG